MELSSLLPELLKGLANFTLGNAVMLTAAATGAKPPVGDHGAVRL